ncbi:MAG: GH92 family glycosyl hydrolase [Bacteroidales bacterium]|nr:GH92 family glycosyl hydrolase [Bacteroidales bacterium]
MKQQVLLIMSVVLLVGCGNKSLTSYVNPMVGTDGHGHTFPGAIVPFGQIQPGPDTRLSGWDGCSGYHYSDDTIFGFSHTHLSGTGCEDYGDVLLMPIDEQEMREVRFGSAMREGYKHHFQHKNETARAGYYKVMLDDGGLPCTIVELTADRRVAYHRYTYVQDQHNSFVIDLRHRDVLLDGNIRLTDDGLLVGYRHSSAWNPDQRLYFAIRSNVPFERVVVSDDSSQAFVQFATAKQAELQVAISGVDINGAIGNLITARYKDFESARQAADRTWEEALAKLRVDDGNTEQKRCFYTALYHCMTSPYLWSDEDGRYRGTDNQIHVADEGREVYTVFSLWDTYRALHPLLTQIEPERTVDFVYSAMKQYEQGGELPMWELAAHETHCMIGYHAAPMLLEAYNYLHEEDGTIAGYTSQQLLEAMVATSNRTPEHRAYAAQGYLSSEIDNESVSKTLEYAYDDWCIAQMATIAGDTATARTYWVRSQSWQNVIDSNGFAHARRNGGWVTPFDPTEVNNHFTEANSWQYSTYVPHDIDAWVERLGGKENALAFLDSLFEGKNALSGRDQVDVTGLIGMYAHGNEPSHHAAWLYTYLGQPKKTQKYVHYILDHFYTSQPDGLCGNEDCGQMSAWYVLASLGMYEICPGSGIWVRTEPIFENDLDWALASDPLGEPLCCPDSLRITPCPVFADWRMQSSRDKVTDTTAQWEGRLRSQTVRHVEVKTSTDKHVTYQTQPAPQYTENGPEGMVDNIRGTANYRIGGWQGWQGDMVATVELDKEQTIHYVGLDCLEHMRSWIFFPSDVLFEYSLDGQQWQRMSEVSTTQFPTEHYRQEESVTHIFSAERTVRAKYIRVTATNFGKLPDWHVSAGEQAWLFADEIIIK